MHICLLTSGRPFEVVFGGEERFTISLGKWLLSRNHAVTIVGRKLFGAEVVRGSFNAPSVESKVSLERPRRVQLPYQMFILTMLFTSLLFVLHVISINRISRISVIHAQDTGYGGLSAVVAAKILRIPVIVSSHGLRYITISNALKGISKSLSLPWEYWLDVFVTKRADVLINVSLTGEEFFTKMGLKKNKMKKIPIAIEVKSFRVSEEVRQTLRKGFGNKNAVLIGFVGRFAPEKNLFTLVEAFAKVLKHVDDMRLILVGAGPLEEKIIMFSHNRGIHGSVVFTGIRYDVNRLLSALDIFVLPSYTEGCPTSLIEAMASGKAIVASDIPSIREIVRHGEEAILVNPYKMEGLKQALLQLHDNADLRADLGRKAMERSELYDVNRVYVQILKLYQNLASKQKPKNRKN